MNNFPFFQHYAVKLVFPKNVEINEELVNKTAELLISKLNLKVVSIGRHEFTNNGLTKFFVLSQSHLVIHSWPENQALHVDLMTCSQENEIKDEKILESLGASEVELVKLDY